MRKKFLSKLVIASLLVGGINFLPINFNADNLQIISVAHAEIKTLSAVGRAEFNFGENNQKLTEMAKNYARMTAVQATKEKAGIYLKSFSRTVNGILTDDDISVVSSNNAEVLDVQYKKVPYASYDVKGNATGEIGVAYEATVTIKIDSNELSEYIKRDQKEKFTLAEQVKSSQQNIAEINKNIEDLNKTAKNKTSKEIQDEIKKIDSLILAQQKNNEGLELYYQKNYQVAISKYTESIKLNPNLAAAYYYRGFTYYTLQNYEQALKDFSQAIKLNQNVESAYYYRGLTYYLLKNYEQAIKDFDKTVELNPKNYEAYRDRGFSHELLNNYMQAIKDYKQAIKLNPNDEESHSNLNNIYNDLYDSDKGIEYLTQAIKLDSNDALAYYWRGMAYEYLENYNQAISDYNQAIKLKPNYAVAYHFRGICYQALGKTAEAEKDFAKARELGYKVQFFTE